MVIDETHSSPNHSARRGTIRALVLHTTEGAFPSDLHWLCNPQPGNPAARVSAHYVIDPDGDIYQLVPDERAAWHAGRCWFAGVTDWNDISIGIEVSHTQGHAWPDVQQRRLTMLARSLVEKHHITPGFVVTHRQIAYPRGRKVDPTDMSDADFAAFVPSLYAPIAALFQVTAERGVNVRAEPSPTATKLGALPKGALFHGEVVQGVIAYGVREWVKRLPSEGGGYAWKGAVEGPL